MKAHLIRHPLASLRLAGFLAWLSIGLGGCGGTPSGDNAPPADGSANPTSHNGSTTEFQFLEDADPTVANLPYVEDELITQTTPGADPSCVEAAITDSGASTARSIPELQTTIVRVDPERFIETAALLDANPLIESVHKNYLFTPERVPDDTEWPAQAYLDNIQLPRAWDITTGAGDIIIAILDTGVATDHPDLADRLLDGWNAFDGNPDARDIEGHGTSVAGVAGAIANNGLGVAGVSWVSPILPVRVTNASGLASAQAIAEGMVWAVNRGAKVINVSFAPLQADATILRAAAYVRGAGGLVFISAGNDGQLSSATADANAIFVGATNTENVRASFSTAGPFVDLAAPGTAIFTTSAGGDYRTVSGTSFSSPIAAGVASLVWSVKPNLRPTTVAEILYETAVDLGDPGRDDNYGEGLIDAAQAVGRARTLVEQGDNGAPQVSIDEPATGEEVSDLVTVEVIATDAETGVADVVLLLDGQPFATDAFAPYRFVVDAASLEQGAHTLSAIATDRTGNSTAALDVQVFVGSPPEDDRCIASTTDSVSPEVIINFPADGATVTGSVGIQATATDNLQLSGAALYIDDVLIANQNLSGVRDTANFVWDATPQPVGQYQLTLRVTDQVGNEATTSITLTKR